MNTHDVVTSIERNNYGKAWFLSSTFRLCADIVVELPTALLETRMILSTRAMAVAFVQDRG
jgi:hypothetical protein